MQNITSVDGLKNAIRVLEVEQDYQRRLLKEHIYHTCESLKPANLLRNVLKQLFSSQYLTEKLSGSAIGVTGGFILKKIFIGESANKLRKLIGAILQLGLTKFITQNSDQIISFGRIIFQHLFRRKELSKRKPSR
jgi:hypothetical protein